MEAGPMAISRRRAGTVDRRSKRVKRTEMDSALLGLVGSGGLKDAEALKVAEEAVRRAPSEAP